MKTKPKKPNRLSMASYIKYLNEAACPPQGDDKWIIGGTIRMFYMWKQDYGTALKIYDPICFRVGYQDWVREQEDKK